MEESRTISRRKFLIGSATVGAGALAAGLVGCNNNTSSGGSGGGGGGEASGPPAKMIGVEEHWYPEFFFKEPGSPGYATVRAADAAIGGISEKICEADSARIAIMDKYGLDMQILSLGGSSVDSLPATRSVPIIKDCNDALAEVLKKNPTRFKGMVALPASVPDKSVEELERCMKIDGFVGMSVLSHINGHFLDEPQYADLLAAAEKLKAPIYIHPTYPIPAVKDALYNFQPPQASTQLSQASMGWHYDTAVHVMRLILTGVFDRYPNLKVVVGHMGEGLPFFINRLESTTNGMIMSDQIPLKKKVPEYLRSNIYYSFGAFNWKPLYDILVTQMGVDQILFSTDFPFSPGSGQDAIDVAVKFFNELGLNASDRDKVAFQNVEKLYNL